MEKKRIAEASSDNGDTIEVEMSDANKSKPLTVTDEVGKEQTQDAAENEETYEITLSNDERERGDSMHYAHQKLSEARLRFVEEGTGQAFKIQVVDVMDTIRRIIGGEKNVQIEPIAPVFNKRVTPAISMGDIYSRVMDRNDDGFIQANEIDERNWILCSTNGDYIRPWSLLQRYVKEYEAQQEAKNQRERDGSLEIEAKQAIAPISSPRRSLHEHETAAAIDLIQQTSDKLSPSDGAFAFDEKRVKSDSSLDVPDSDSKDKGNDIQLTFLKIPRVKNSEIGPRRTSGVSTLTDVFNFFCRCLWFWSFISWFAIAFCTASSAVVEILLSVWGVWRDDFMYLTKVCYFIGAVLVLGNFLFLFVIYMGTLIELTKAFSLRKFELNRIFMYFPAYIDFIEEAGNRYRYYAMVFVLVGATLISVIAEQVDDGYTDNLEGGLFSTFFSYATTLVLGGGVSMMYVLALIATDIFSMYKGLVKRRYLDETLQWLRYAPDCRYRNWWFILTRTLPPEDDSLRNPKNWNDKMRFTWWLLTHSYVPYQLCSPLFLVSVMAAVSLGSWAYPMAVLIPWTAFGTHVLRHWRIEVLKFRAGQLIDKHGREIPINIGKGDSERHDQKRTFRLRCCYVGTFFLGAMCMFMYAAILFTNRDEFAVDFRDKVYPLCSLEFTNRNLENSLPLDTMDSIVLCDTVYLDSANLTQTQLLRYFGTSHYCTDFVNQENCAPDKWRMVHYQYDDHPVWFHLHHPASKLHVISIRGTWDFNDFMQDMVLFAEIISLQAIGLFIPIFNIWSHSLISTVVDRASLWSGAMYPDANKKYYEDPYEYLKDLGIPNEDEFLLAMGHSLGGGVAQIIAAKLFDRGFRNVQSFSLSAPGVLYSTKKFDFSVEGLAYTSINALGERDPFTYVDRHLGLLTKFECNRELAVDCHSAYQSMCEVAGSCWSSDSLEEGTVQPSKFNYVVQECDNPTNSGG